MITFDLLYDSYYHLLVFLFLHMKYVKQLDKKIKIKSAIKKIGILNFDRIHNNSKLYFFNLKF